MRDKEWYPSLIYYCYVQTSKIIEYFPVFLLTLLW